MKSPLLVKGFSNVGFAKEYLLLPIQHIVRNAYATNGGKEKKMKNIQAQSILTGLVMKHEYWLNTSCKGYVENEKHAPRVGDE